MPQITVIVPVYRAESYLNACVDSILSQTFSDFEVFLVNDGSPDGCGRICDDYARKDNRVRVIHQENQGQAAARNHALARAEGTWICFIDSDDLVHPQMLQRLYEAAITHNAGITMCPMVEAQALTDDFFAQPEDTLEVLPVNEQTLVQLFDREEYPSWVACAKLIRKSCIDVHPFCEGRVYEDNEAVCHWMYQTQTLVRLKAPMYFYRTNPGSTTQQGFSVKKMDYLWALESIIRFYDAVDYPNMKLRFARLYGGEIINCGYGIRSVLQDPGLLKDLRVRARRFAAEQNIRFPLEIQEQILDALYPKLIRFYWPAKGIARRVSRIFPKRKGERQ